MEITIIYGSVRDERQGIRVAKHIQKNLQEKKIKTNLLDPKKHEIPLLNQTYTENQTNKTLKKISQTLKKSDAYILVSAEYNHLPPPALINLLDHFHQEFHKKPCAIATYSTGIFGGMRAAISLRTIIGGLGMISTPNMQAYPEMTKIIDEKGNTNQEITQRTTNFTNELIWYSKALKNQRKKDNSK